ncbi:MAG: hypothetical protein GY811_06505 [Myxococcales bacterium]|nr:hypothetical protein [Myxococcales bacterium]
MTQYEPFGVLAPVRVSPIARLGSHFILNAWASNALSLGQGRKNSPQHALFGDELHSGLILRAGSSGKMRGGSHQVTYGNGYFVGVLYSEGLGTLSWGLTVGHGLNVRGASGQRNRGVPGQRGR